jgi:restriction system protein
MTDNANVHVPHLPDYGSARKFIQLMEGQSRRNFLNMRDIVLGNRGTPQNTKDWSNPELWIPELLKDKDKEIALHIWRNSNRTINPRHLTGLWLLASSYELIDDSQDILRLTPIGQDFLTNEFGDAEQTLDSREGLLALLRIVAEYGPGKRSDFLRHFAEFLAKNSNIRSESAINSYWYSRMRNLVDRGLIAQSGIVYQVTDEGLKYLKQTASKLKGDNSSLNLSEPLATIQQLRLEQDKLLGRKITEKLAQMNPYAFEALIGRLLEAMGYNDVVVTKKSGDKGVDVLGNIEVGITTVREVVQVKRFNRGSVGRREVNELRGSLPEFHAIRGTIITTGKIAQPARDAAYVGAPITLIDGEKLVNLLIKYRIGVVEEVLEPFLVFNPVDFEIGEDTE